LARGANGKLRIAEETVDPRHTLQEAVAVVRPEAEAKGVRLLTAFDRGAGLVRGDVGRLQQIAWNLLSNAVKFTEPGGTIEVSLQAGDTDLFITVEDTGPGLDGPTLASLFTPFQK